MSKLALGTAQFGMEYSIANISGKTTIDEASKILSVARNNGIDMLDTAIVYGDSEKVLGRIGVENYRVITKLPSSMGYQSNHMEWVESQVIKSLKNLKKNQLYGFLLHNPKQLLEKNGVSLYNALDNLKSQGLIKKIGVSIYSPDELGPLIKNFDLDIVQAPINVFDRTMELSGIGSELKKLGVEIHARSIFLQGLLLMKPSLRPQKFLKWKKEFNSFDTLLNSNCRSALEISLKYVEQLNFVDKLVVGVDNKNHLEQIIAAIRSDAVEIPVIFNHEDKRLINPSRWREL